MSSPSMDGSARGNFHDMDSSHVHRMAGCSLNTQGGADAGGPQQLTTTMMIAYTAMRGGAHGVCLVGPEDPGPLIQDLSFQERTGSGGRRGMLVDSMRSQVTEESWHDTWEDNRQTSFVYHRPAGFQHLVGVPPSRITTAEHAGVPAFSGASNAESSASLPLQLRPSSNFPPTNNFGGEDFSPPTTPSPLPLTTSEAEISSSASSNSAETLPNNMYAGNTRTMDSDKTVTPRAHSGHYGFASAQLDGNNLNSTSKTSHGDAKSKDKDAILPEATLNVSGPSSPLITHMDLSPGTANLPIQDSSVDPDRTPRASASNSQKLNPEAYPFPPPFPKYKGKGIDMLNPAAREFVPSSLASHSSSKSQDMDSGLGIGGLGITQPTLSQSPTSQVEETQSSADEILEASQSSTDQVKEAQYSIDEVVEQSQSSTDQVKETQSSQSAQSSDNDSTPRISTKAKGKQKMERFPIDKDDDQDKVDDPIPPFNWDRPIPSTNRNRLPLPSLATPLIELPFAGRRSPFFPRPPTPIVDNCYSETGGLPIDMFEGSLSDDGEGDFLTTGRISPCTFARWATGAQHHATRNPREGEAKVEIPKDLPRVRPPTPEVGDDEVPEVDRIERAGYTAAVRDEVSGEWLSVAEWPEEVSVVWDAPGVEITRILAKPNGARALHRMDPVAGRRLKEAVYGKGAVGSATVASAGEHFTTSEVDRVIAGHQGPLYAHITGSGAGSFIQTASEAIAKYKRHEQACRDDIERLQREMKELEEEKAKAKAAKAAAQLQHRRLAHGVDDARRERRILSHVADHMRDLRAEVDRSWAASAIAAHTRNAMAEEAARLRGEVERVRQEAASAAALPRNAPATSPVGGSRAATRPSAAAYPRGQGAVEAPGHAGADERERRRFLPLPAQGAPAPAATPIPGHGQSGFNYGSQHPATGYAAPNGQHPPQGLDVAAERAVFSVAVYGIPDTTGTVIVDHRFAAARGENNRAAQLTTNFGQPVDQPAAMGSGPSTALGQGFRLSGQYIPPYVAAYAGPERPHYEERHTAAYTPQHPPFYSGPANDNEHPFINHSTTTTRPQALTTIPPGFSHHQNTHRVPPIQHHAQIPSPVTGIPHTAHTQANPAAAQNAFPPLGTTPGQAWNQQAPNNNFPRYTSTPNAWNQNRGSHQPVTSYIRPPPGFESVALARTRNRNHTGQQQYQQPPVHENEFGNTHLHLGSYNYQGMNAAQRQPGGMYRGSFLVDGNNDDH